MNTLIYKIDSDIDKLSLDVVQLLRKNNNIRLVTAESCTGGLLSGAVTSAAGASEVFGLGLCVYENEMKEKYLGVKAETLTLYGAVSWQTASEMAQGALKTAGNRKNAISVSVTGIAGPDGGTPEKPVGTVHFSCVFRESAFEKRLHLKIDASAYPPEHRRGYIRRESVRQALILIKDVIYKYTNTDTLSV